MADADPRLALVFTEAQRSIARQLDTVNQLRSNTGTLLGAVSLTTAFLGGLHGRRPLGAWGWVAIVAFVVAISLAVAILWPRTRWLFQLKTDVLLEGYVNAGASLDVMHRQLAGFMARDYRENRDRLGRMFNLFSVATIAMAVEVVAWLIDLRGS